MTTTNSIGMTTTRRGYLMWLILLVIFVMLFAFGGGKHWNPPDGQSSTRAKILKSSSDNTVLKTTSGPNHMHTQLTKAQTLKALSKSTKNSIRTMEYGYHALGKKYDNLIYIYNPKAGSSTMREVLQTNGTQIQLGDFNTSQYFTFSMLRNPHERLASAYSTILFRNVHNGTAGYCGNTTNYRPAPTMPHSKNLTEWHQHFRDTIAAWVSDIERFQKKQQQQHECLWNEHLLPQTNFLKGYDLKWLGCLETINETFQVMTNATPLLPAYDANEVVRAYEHPPAMPDQKFASINLLPPPLIARIDQIYHQDWKLYQTFCG